MKKSFIVIGLGRFGSNIAKALVDMNLEVLAIDISAESVNSVAKKVPHCFVADATKIDVLTELGAQTIDHAVIAIGNNLQASILTIVNLKTIGVKRITVRADFEEHRELYMRLGADEVIVPEEASAVSLANQINSDSILDYYIISEDYVMVKIIVGQGFNAKSLIELDIRNNFDVNVVGIIREGAGFFIPRGTDKLIPGDIVVVAGKKPNIRRFDTFLN